MNSNKTFNEANTFKNTKKEIKKTFKKLLTT